MAVTGLGTLDGSAGASRERHPDVRAAAVPAGAGSAARPDAAWDLLVVLLGAPHARDEVSTALRWAHAAARRGGRVQVWTCGHATLLTGAALGEEKPTNVLDWAGRAETSATWATRFVEEHEGRTRWLVCRFCSDERGAGTHVAVARVRPATAFARHVRESARTLVVGVI